MNATTQRILSDALLLPDHERAELAASLIDSLEPTVDEDSEQAWESEVQRRVKELESGDVVPLPCFRKTGDR